MEEVKQSPPASKPWSFFDKFIFLFLSVYFAIFVLPSPLDYFIFDEKWLNTIYETYFAFWLVIVQWVGKNILNIPNSITVLPNGSGDTTFNYVFVLLNLSIALIISLLWLIIDRRRPSYNQLFYWFTVLLRYYLAFVMFNYGFAKIFKSQFPFPSPYRLLEPYGDSSPMGLLWTFMGYSYTYNVFTGLGEVVGGFFLLFRRTTTLGACILIAVLGNVVVLNFAYDVPVKLYSSHLLLMAVVLFLIDLPRILAFFVLNVPTPPAEMPWVSRYAAINFTLLGIKFILIGYAGYLIVSQAISREKSYGDNAPKPPFYGIYEVETYIVNKDTIPPLVTDTTRWRKLIIQRKDFATVILMNDSLKRYNFKPDISKKIFTVYTAQDTVHKYVLKYQEPNKNTLLINGILKKDTIQLKMRKLDMNKFLLINRKFNWINEYPFNR